jgi:sulfhydrogenase subunit gamma (sulfur reductase)
MSGQSQLNLPATQQDPLISAEDPYIPRPARILKTKRLSDKERLFRLALADGGSLGHAPGQFIEISVYGTGECPISVSSSPTSGPAFELVVRKTGMVTAALHRLAAEDKVGIRGPFGKGFDTAQLKGNDLILVGGGIGMVPLRSLIRFVIDNRKDFGRINVLYGCREPGELLFVEEFNDWFRNRDVKFLVTVDRCKPEDNWEGKVGVITTLIPSLDINPVRTYSVIVGPPVMYGFVISALKEKMLPDQRMFVSLERRMKCGVGKCGHCQMGQYFVCQDGPVFNYGDIRNAQDAI